MVSDINTLLTGTGLAGLLAIIIQQYIKPFLELKIKPNNPLHDPMIRIIAILLGALGSTANYLLTISGSVTWVGVRGAIIVGAAIGLGAITNYHLLGSARSAATNLGGLGGFIGGTTTGSSGATFIQPATHVWPTTVTNSDGSPFVPGPVTIVTTKPNSEPVVATPDSGGSGKVPNPDEPVVITPETSEIT
jgi:hypothetical protein